MQLYDRGIRRRLAPMLDNDRRKLELAFSLLFTLPGTPMLQYGDEIGIGDDLPAGARMRAHADAVVGRPPRRLLDRGAHRAPGDHRIRSTGTSRVNVEAQRRDPHSLLNWIERKIRMRQECPEISWGDWKILDAGTPGVLRCATTGATTR